MSTRGKRLLLLAVAVLLVAASAAWAEDAGTFVDKVKLVLDGKAKANGEITVMVAFADGEKKDVKVTVAEKMHKQAIARDLAKELTVALGEGYKVDQYDDDKIKIEAKKDAKPFAVQVGGVAVQGVSIMVK